MFRHEDQNGIDCLSQTISPMTSVNAYKLVENQREGSLHKLSFCGKQTKKLWFNFPEEMDGCEQKSITNADEIRMFSNRVIKRIT